MGPAATEPAQYRDAHWSTRERKLCVDSGVSSPNIRRLARTPRVSLSEATMLKQSSWVNILGFTRKLKPEDSTEKQGWGRFMTFPVGIVRKKEEDALQTAQQWRHRNNTTRTDGSSLDNGRVGSPARQASEGGSPTRHGSQQDEPADTSTSVPIKKSSTPRRMPPAIEARYEENKHYTISSDSTAAISRRSPAAWDQDKLLPGP